MTAASGAHGAHGRAAQPRGKTEEKAHEAHGEAERAANSRTLTVLTRVGFVGYGVLHLAIAWVAVQIALGRPRQEGDQSGALSTLAGQPFGRVLLAVVALGLVAMAVWQALVAAIANQDKVSDRVASGLRAVVYAFLAYSTGKTVISGGPGSSAQKQQQASAGIMGHTAGVWLIGLIGLVVLGLGIGFIGYGVLHKFDDKLAVHGQASRSLSRWLGGVGYVAKGVAYGIVGVLLGDAAITHDPKKSRGLDAALHAVVAQPFGRVLLIVVGAGIGVFGVFCFFQARYRKVGA